MRRFDPVFDREGDIVSAEVTGLAGFKGVLFDLDGVLTPTAEVHMRAWQRTFEDLFSDFDEVAPYQEADYFRFLDGKKRFDAVASLLRERDIEMPWGTENDAPSELSVGGIGNRKNQLFNELLNAEGIKPYPGSLKFLNYISGLGLKLAVVSSSRNASEVLRMSGLNDSFPIVVDGAIATERGLASKPAADMFSYGAELLGLATGECFAVEDAVSGVQAAKAARCGLVIAVDRGVGAASLLQAGADRVVKDLADLIPASADASEGA